MGLTTYLVRHAKAGSRERWTAPDRDRPLSPPGLLQADGLAVLLASAGITSIRSSPYLRCIQTVAPLARAAHLEVEPEDGLGEGAGPAWALGALAGHDGTVLCTHGDVMAAVVVAIAARGVPLGNGRRWEKGSTWAFSVSGGRIVAGRYLQPP